MKRFVLIKHPHFKLEVYDTLNVKGLDTQFPSYTCIYGDVTSWADSVFLDEYKIDESDNLEEIYERICIEEL